MVAADADEPLASGTLEVSATPTAAGAQPDTETRDDEGSAAGDTREAKALTTPIPETNSTMAEEMAASLRSISTVFSFMPRMDTE